MGRRKQYIPDELSEEELRRRTALKNLLVKRETSKMLYPHYFVERRICKQLGLPLPEKTADVKFWEMKKASRLGISILYADF